MANAEPAAEKLSACLVCGSSPVVYQWSDYSGQAMCRSCGTPYQLKWGTPAQVAEGKYPYLGLRDEFVPIVREYHAETGRFTCLGMMLGPCPGMAEFVEWCKVHHPSVIRVRADSPAEPDGERGGS